MYNPLRWQQEQAQPAVLQTPSVPQHGTLGGPGQLPLASQHQYPGPAYPPTHQYPGPAYPPAQPPIVPGLPGHLQQPQHEGPPVAALPPHLQQQVQQPLPQQVQQMQPQPAAMPGLMGLLAAKRQQAAQQQAAQQQAAGAPHQQHNQLPAQQPAGQTSNGQLWAPTSTYGNTPSAQSPAPDLAPRVVPPPGFNPVPAVQQLAAVQVPALVPPGYSANPANVAASTAAVAAAAASQEAVRLPRHLQPSSNSAAPGTADSTGQPTGIAAEAPAGPAEAAKTAAAAAPTSAQQPTAANNGQPAARPPAAAAAAGAVLQQRPQPTLQGLKELLMQEAHSNAPVSHNLGEALKWLEGYAPEAHQVIDESFMTYLNYTVEKHGTSVQSCICFYTLGHHDYMKGATKNLSLYTADYPAKVLNQRVSFYRLLFSNPPKWKADVLSCIVAHRPDVAAWVSDEFLRRVFDPDMDEGVALTALAALPLLPEGWSRLVQSPGPWLGHYLAAVMQDHNNADRMAGFLWRKLGAAQAAAAAASSSATSKDPSVAPKRPAAVNWGPAVAALPTPQLPPPAATAAAGSAAPNLLQGLMLRELQKVKQDAQQQQLTPSPRTDRPGAAAAAASVHSPVVGSPAGGTVSFASLLKAQEHTQQQHQQQQQPGAAEAGGRTAAAVLAWSSSTGRAMAKATGPGSSSPSALQQRSKSMSGVVAEGGGGNSSSADAAGAGGSQRNSSDAGASEETIQMAFVQLAKDRRDVVPFLKSDLLRRIKAMPLQVALSVLGTLNDLPTDWKEKALEGKKKPGDWLEVVAVRAAAHAQEAFGISPAGASGRGSGAAEDDDGWAVVAGNSSSSAAGTGRDSSGKGESRVTLWQRLEQERPDIWAVMDDRHVNLIKKLSGGQQAKVLTSLLTLSKKSVARAQEPEALVFSFLANTVKMLTQSMPPQLQAALQALADAHPSVVPHMDEGIFGRLQALPLNKALLAVQALQEGDYGPRWEEHCRNVSAWLMGIITRAIAKV